MSSFPFLFSPQVLSCSGGTIYRDPSKQYCSHRSHNHLISLGVLDASHNQIADVKLFRYMFDQV